MSGTSVHVKLVFVLLLALVLAMALGNEPWGPT
jgi:hypothetical protein